MTPAYDQLLAELVIYERGNLQYTRCLCRGTEVLVTGQPEEWVRQVLLLHLMRRSGLYPGTIDLRAEFNDLDVAILKPPAHERFRPMPRPLVIIEVKRREAELRDHEGQLFDYLAANQTEAGVLYNGRELLVYVPDGCGGWGRTQLGLLNELDDWIRREVCRPDPDLDTFLRATSGCTASFLALAEAYGRYTLHRITFTLKGSSDPITGCCFRIQNEHIYYDVYGKYTRKQKIYFRRSDFDRLVSLVY